MDSYSIKPVWKRRYGYAGATFLAYLVVSSADKDGDGWFDAPMNTLHKQMAMSARAVMSARDALTDDMVVEAKVVGGKYRYRINEERLAEVESAGMY